LEGLNPKDTGNPYHSTICLEKEAAYTIHFSLGLELEQDIEN
jgi:hypothetical protein